MSTTRGEHKKRNWDKVDLDSAYMSHHHTVEVLLDLPVDLGIVTYGPTTNITPTEYRNTFHSGMGLYFSVSTILNIDSSTYTYIHLDTPGSVLSLRVGQYLILSNSNISRPEGRQFREKEIAASLMALKITPSPAKVIVKRGNDGIVLSKDEDGYILDYSGLRSAKIESADRVLDYADFNRISSNGIPKRPLQNS